MPLHDWSQLEAGIYHDFHTAWITEIRSALNEGLLPSQYYALAEAPLHLISKETIELELTELQRSLTIRHVSTHRIVALLEIVSPANKDRPEHVRQFASKTASALRQGIHVLVVDPFGAGKCDPRGIDYEIRTFLLQPPQLEQSRLEPANLISYAVGDQLDIYRQNVERGAPLSEMPLFLQRERYVNVPLEETYLAAWRGVPAFWKEVVESETK